jgi:hypothetical protein
MRDVPNSQLLLSSRAKLQHNSLAEALNDTNNQIGDGVQDEFAEWERKEITKRTRAGKMEKARSGRVVQSAAPYGFRRVGEGKDTHYEQDSATMSIVRRIIEAVAGGASLRSIQLQFHEEGIPSPGGKALWSPEAIRRVVLQDVHRAYTHEELQGLVEEGVLEEKVLANLDPEQSYGVWWYGQEEVRKTRRGRKVVPRPRDQWVACPVLLDSGGVVIPAEVVDKARAAIGNNERPSRADNIFWQLSGGNARCVCGRTMLPKRTIGKGKIYHYYCCHSYWRTPAERCGYGKVHPAKKLEERVEGWVLSLVRDPEILREKVAAQAETERQRLSRASHDVARLRARLEAVAKTRCGYLQQQAEGIIETLDELRALLAPLDSERTAIEQEIEALGDQEDRLRQLDMLPTLVDEYLRDLAYLVEGSGVELRDYETIPEERTETNLLGVYTLTPERVRTLSEEEQIARRIEAHNARAMRFHDLYQSLGLTVVVHKDGTLDISWSLGPPARILPGVAPASMGMSG